MSQNRSMWKKRLPTKIYDYNYKVCEGYYKPQTDYINSKANDPSIIREGPPKHKTYAERFAYSPWYGEVQGLPYDEKLSALAEPLLKPSERKRGSTLVREIKEPEEENIPLHIRASRRRKKFEDEERAKGVISKPNRFYPKTDIPRNKYRDTINKINEIDNIVDSSYRSLHTAGPNTGNYPSTYSSSSKHDLPGTNSYSRNYDTRIAFSSVSYKPPLIPHRKISTEYGNKMIAESVYKPWPQRRSSFSSGEIPSVVFNRAEKFRQGKRSDESKDFASSITGLVDKLRVGNLDENAAYHFATNLKSSSLEPPSRRGSRKGRIIYGVAK